MRAPTDPDRDIEGHPDLVVCWRSFRGKPTFLLLDSLSWLAFGFPLKNISI